MAATYEVEEPRALRAVELALFAFAFFSGLALGLVRVLAETKAIQPAEFPEAQWLFDAAPSLGGFAWVAGIAFCFFELCVLFLVRAEDPSLRFGRALACAGAAWALYDVQGFLLALLGVAWSGAVRADSRLSREPREGRLVRGIENLEASGSGSFLRMWLAGVLAFSVPVIAEVAAREGAPRGDLLWSGVLGALLAGGWLAMRVAVYVAIPRWLSRVTTPASEPRERRWPREAFVAAILLALLIFLDFPSATTGPYVHWTWGLVFLGPFAYRILSDFHRSERGVRLISIGFLVACLTFSLLWGLLRGALGAEMEALGLVDVIAALCLAAGLAVGSWTRNGFARLMREEDELEPKRALDALVVAISSPAAMWLRFGVARAFGIAFLALIGFVCARAATPRHVDFSAVLTPVYASLVACALFGIVLMIVGVSGKGMKRPLVWLVPFFGVSLLLYLSYISVAVSVPALKHEILERTAFLRSAHLSAHLDSATAWSLRPEEPPPPRESVIELQLAYPDAPEAARFSTRRPPIVWIVWDGARADRCGFGGATRNTTPNADALAREGVVFEHALAGATATSASMRMMLSGSYQSRYMLDVHHAPLLLNDLLELGYERLFVNVHGSDYNGIGEASFLRGPHSEELNEKVVFFPEYDEEEKARRAVQLLAGVVEEDREAEAENPGDGVFLLIHSAATHYPWKDHEGVDVYGAKPEDRFDHALAHTDRWCGFVFDALREYGLWDEALIVLTADHGTGLGERGRPGGFLPWEEQLRVPLIVKAPGFEPARVTTPVSSIDLVPTLISLFRPGAANPDHGWSLVELMAGRTAALDRRYLVSLASFADAYALHDRLESRKLIWFRAAEYRFLFDLAADPGETRDLASVEAASVERYQRWLELFVRQGPWGDPHHYRPADR